MDVPVSPVPNSPHTHRLAFIFVLVLGTLALIAAGLYVYRDTIKNISSTVLLPQDLEGAIFLYTEDTNIDRVLAARLLRSGVVPLDALNARGSVESLARQGNTIVAISSMTNSLLTEVVLIETDTTRVIASSATEKRAIAMSPNGTYIAWSEAANLPEGVPYGATTDAWVIRVWSRADEAVRTVGTGYGPQFLMDETLLFTTPEHLALVQLPEGEPEPQPYPGADSIALTAKVSAASNILLVPRTDSSTYLVYKVLLPRPLTTESLGELPASFHDVALGTSSVFGLASEEGHKMIVRMPYNDLGRHVSVFTFPEAFEVKNLVP